MGKALVLQVKHGNFKGEDGKSVNYESYFVEIDGIQLALKPVDNTAKQIIRNYFEKNPDLIFNVPVK